jgi:predicted transposase YbfD/YdcC
LNRKHSLHHGNKERRSYLTSITHIKDFARVFRRHWSVENKFQWILDVAFKEDLSRVRVQNAAEKFSIPGRIASNLLKPEKNT